MSDETFVTVESAARSTGISARTLRYWIATGKLTATAERRGKRVSLADVERIARVTGKLSGSATVDPASVPGSATATAAPLPEIAVAVEADRQLATLREGLVAPLIHLTEQLTTLVAEQAEQLGRVTAERDELQRRVAIQKEAAILEREQIQAERDALEMRVRALEARQRSAQDTIAVRAIERDTTPQMATGARQKRRQRRWWLRLFGVDE